MNVYDFDKTIFDGDTEDYFFAYLFKVRRLPFYKLNYEWHELLCRHKIAGKTFCRRADYRVLTQIEDIDTFLEEYWNEHEKFMMPWYFEVKQPDDLIATGTPRFLMEPIMRRLGLKNLIATDMDRKTGRINGRFLGAHLKVDVFNQQFPGQKIDRFYSDTYSDHFLADIADSAFLIEEDGTQTEWYQYFEQHPEKKTIPYRY